MSETNQAEKDVLNIDALKSKLDNLIIPNPKGESRAKNMGSVSGGWSASGGGDKHTHSNLTYGGLNWVNTSFTASGSCVVHFSRTNRTYPLSWYCIYDQPSDTLTWGGGGASAKINNVSNGEYINMTISVPQGRVQLIVVNRHPWGRHSMFMNIGGSIVIQS